MIGNGTPALIAALVSFILFFANVSMGAAGLGAPLGDVPEMLLLFLTAILFVAGVLSREKARPPKDNNE